MQLDTICCQSNCLIVFNLSVFSSLFKCDLIRLFKVNSQ